MKLSKIIRKIEKKFQNNEFTTVKQNVNGEQFFFNEIIDIDYNFEFDELLLHKDIEAPLQEENEERNFIVNKTCELYSNFFASDIHTRQACFVNNYDGKDNHCISYFHFYVRENFLNLNVYIRSMNYDTNFLYDNQTFTIAFNELLFKIKEYFLNVEAGNISCYAFSMHKKVKV